MVEHLTDEEARRKREEILFGVGLYKRVAVHVDELLELATRADRFDIYCVECKQSSTFKGTDDCKRAYYAGRLGARHYNDEVDVRLACTRNENHVIQFLFLSDDAGVTKIGQHPSMAAVALGDLSRFDRVLDDVDRSELARGIGLDAHGIGVGSFVYLRRILERLVIKTEKELDITVDPRAKIVERIKALHDHVPDFLVENTHLHGILSKGIHELGEDECKTAFPVVRAAIEEVFEDRLADLQRREARERTARELNALNSQLAQRDSDSSDDAAAGSPR